MRAALELFGEVGFDNTTVVDIAERAGLSERTFFRYFVDKRDVLFAGSASLQALLVDLVERAPASDPPMAVVIGALKEMASTVFGDWREAPIQRHAIIAAHPELQERELIKLSAVASAIAETLRRRGVAEPTATLAAETGVTVFKVAFEAWVNADEGRSLDAIIGQLHEEMKVALA